MHYAIQWLNKTKSNKLQCRLNLKSGSLLLAVAMSIGILLGYKMNNKTERLVKR